MSKKKSPPKYLIIYRCPKCGQDSGHTERDKPRCRFCGNTVKLTVVSKQQITREVISARLKIVAENMMSNLINAYEQLPHTSENIVAEGKDAEMEILKLMEKTKQLKDKLEKKGIEGNPRKGVK